MGAERRKEKQGDTKPLFSPVPCEHPSPLSVPRPSSSYIPNIANSLAHKCVLVSQVFNGYFVHFFAPENMDPIPKNILFVIDVSGSMWGIKMKQVSTPGGQWYLGLPTFSGPLLMMQLFKSPSHRACLSSGC